ncbi:MAG: hypothetical protein KDN19_03310 [Verrucomicrobiae bacterium]|nr:hypothetical protein [Verrucomicrobiae bacterium]
MSWSFENPQYLPGDLSGRDLETEFPYETMKTTSASLAILATALTGLAFSQDVRADYDIKEFRAESDISVFALYLTPDNELAGNPGGGGVAFDFYFNENLGVAFSGAWADPDVGDLWQTYIMDLNLRYPVPAGGMAPYIFIGGGAFVGDGSEMLARGGAGLDIRFLPIPLFIDWSYTFLSGGNGVTEPSDFGGLRFGTKFVF